jgi:CheY-like chemotaxis protein
MCIFVVEDEPLIRMILVEDLMDAGYEVREAESADQAVAMLDASNLQPRALVTDVHMPGQTDGIELAAHVRALFPAIPVVFTTGRPDALLRLERLDSRQVLVRKPYVPTEIMRHLRNLLITQ